MMISSQDFAGEGHGGILAKEVLILVLAGEVLGPVLTPHWVHSGLDEDRVLPVDVPLSDNGDGCFSI
jgi:hypothetical protein